MSMLGQLFNRLLGRTEISVLVSRGLKLGQDVHIGPGTFIDPAHCWLITIGDAATLGPRVIVLAHDASMKRHIGYTKIATVHIGRKAFIGAGSIILPGVSIGDGAIVAAGSVVTKNVGEGTIVAGQPANLIGTVNDFVDRHKVRLAQSPRYPFIGWTVEGGISEENKQRMRSDLTQRMVGYVE
jgi:maltose O-acetyltransferase